MKKKKSEKIKLYFTRERKIILNTNRFEFKYRSTRIYISTSQTYTLSSASNFNLYVSFAMLHLAIEK